MDCFKVFIEFVTILRLFSVWSFGHEARGILGPVHGSSSLTLPALEDEALTPGPQGRPSSRSTVNNIQASLQGLKSRQGRRSIYPGATAPDGRGRSSVCTTENWPFKFRVFD